MLDILAIALGLSEVSFVVWLVVMFYLLINLYFQEETSMLIIKIVDFFAMFGFMTFILIVIAVTSAITNKTSRKRKFRRKW